MVRPGHCMLFALDARRLVNPGSKSSVSGAPAQLTLTATTLSGKLVWGSSGLPPGLQINVTSGVTSGPPPPPDAMRSR